MNSIVFLHGKTTSLVLKATSTLPEILYWGPRVSHEDESQWLLASEYPVPQGGLDEHIALTLCPEQSQGNFGSPGLEGSFNGAHWSPAFTQCEIQKQDQSLLVAAVDALAQLRLTISLSLDDDSDVLSLRSELTNLSDQPYQLHRLSLTLPVPSHFNQLMNFTGRWIQEMQQNRQPFSIGSYVQENRRGRTSHQYFPGLIVGPEGFKEQSGEALAVHLGWSGNHKLRAEVLPDGRKLLQAEELLDADELPPLKKGESYTTPVLYASTSTKGLNQVSWQFHQFVRSNVLNLSKDKPRPVHLNTWEGIYFDHQPEYIKQMATRAAAMGIERFVLDDGWFIGRNNDRAALGDWFVDEAKYPEGLNDVIDHVNNLGMEFGLWFEPEMISPDSNVYREHPEWALHQEGYQQPLGRYQMVLDLQNPDAYDYIFQRLDALLADHPIGYIKWDMNRELVQNSHQGKAATHGQTLAFYQLLKDLSNKHPQVEIESCASGGGRVDFEVLKNSQRFWASDCNDALERQVIQKGFSYFFPQEIMGAHIGPQHSHTTSRSHNIQFRGLTAMIGHFGVELDPCKSDAKELEQFQTYIELHKQYRDLMHSGRWFRLDTSESLNSYGVLGEDQMLLWTHQLEVPAYSFGETIKLPFLDGKKNYLVKILSTPEHWHHLMKEKAQWHLNETVIRGELLSTMGLKLPILDPESSLLLFIQAV